MVPPSPGASPGVAAGLSRRLAALAYEFLLLLALVFVAGFAFQGATASTLAGLSRHLFQGYLVLVIALYFIPCWIRGGQTLAMRTWRLRLVTREGMPVTAVRATARYALAWLSLLLCGLGFVWAVWDAEHQFLHDRLTGTRIVRI